MAQDIFAKIGDIKGESLDAKHKDEIEVLWLPWGVATAPGRARPARDLEDLSIETPHRQGHSGAFRGVRDRPAHQGRDDHPPQGGARPAGISCHQTERRGHRGREPRRTPISRPTPKW